ncbi:hypothetical protein KFK09_019224 [Dendrobium nobile]|uniref:Legumain prodomain domain-containing protein n=1 Tax=Dendrobium nobile TaxID=94219 RepID=A0A8T3AWP8_DENNO|nr:hypothetical protein KFK09_019224 [Dendrobium nobile]
MAWFRAPVWVICFAFLFALAMPRAFAEGTRMPMKEDSTDEFDSSTRWAVLVAGSSDYGNYRHQADVCHAYQLLRKGGLKDENIVVLMYDDLANSSLNPRPGVIINNPKGEDVYAGVPKDYTGDYVTAKNLYAVILGNKSAIKGGSGKVVNSKPNDRIFIYYTDHGGPGVLGMPNGPLVYAKDFIDVLKKKHKSNGYKEMVIYVESCESGSLFEGLLPNNLSIYVTTASNSVESSWGTYCPGMDPPPPPEYHTCLGDLYSVSWMEDSDNHNRRNETVKEQYKRVKARALNLKDRHPGSHVMEYGTTTIRNEKLYLYQGFDPFNYNASKKSLQSSFITPEVVTQRDADLLFMWKMYERLDNRSKKEETLKEITETLNHRLHLDNSVDFIGKLIFGAVKGPSILAAVRPSDVPLVDDWNCLKVMVRVFESHCGSLTQYGMKHMRAFANICNNGISKEAMEDACSTACGGYNSEKWSPLRRGYSA